MMPKKIKLNLNDLTVKSFQTGVETQTGGGFTDDGKCVMLSLHPILCDTKNPKRCDSWGQTVEQPNCSDPF